MKDLISFSRLAEQLPQLTEFQSTLEYDGCSQRTIQSYLCSVRLFYTSYPELSMDSLKKFRSDLTDRYQPGTVNTRIYGMNRYLEFLKENGLLPASLLLPESGPPLSPGESIGPVRVSRSGYYKLNPVKLQKKSYLDNVITQRDYEHLKRCLKRDQQMYWYFVVRFLGATGARVSELLQIKIEDLRLGYLDLYTKGGKIRRLYFPEVLCREAIPYFTSRGICYGFIFLNRSGTLITPRGIEMQLKKFAVRYHINPETVYPHSFRHRYAKNFLRRFNDISLLADLMGHDSIETTRIYLMRSSREQRSLLDRIITW